MTTPLVTSGRIGRRWVSDRLPAREPRAHKGTFGRLLVVAGSIEYAGAALLTGLGAARIGAGLVTVATSASVALRLMGQVPELTMMPLDEEAPGLIAPAGWRHLATEAVTYDAAVVGPGLGRQGGTLRRARSLVRDLRRPAVIDADALNALAEADRWWRGTGSALVLTPHPGEFARLARLPGGEPLTDDDAIREDAAREAAIRWGQVVVLKGARTVVASATGDVLVSDVETPALATAGSGDVLAGAIGGLLAGGLEPFEAAVCGVAIHGAAGLLAEQRIGLAGVLARDIAGLLPAAMAEMRGSAR